MPNIGVLQKRDSEHYNSPKETYKARDIRMYITCAQTTTFVVAMENRPLSRLQCISSLLYGHCHHCCCSSWITL